MGLVGPKRLSAQTARYRSAVIEKRRTDPTQNFLEILIEAAGYTGSVRTSSLILDFHCHQTGNQNHRKELTHQRF
jgi:hypothetical protein